MLNASENNSVDILFHKGLHSMEHLPPSDGWARIQPKLPPKKKPFFNFLRLAIAASLIFAVFSFIIWSIDSRKSNTEITASISSIKTPFKTTTGESTIDGITAAKLNTASMVSTSLTSGALSTTIPKAPNTLPTVTNKSVVASLDLITAYPNIGYTNSLDNLSVLDKLKKEEQSELNKLTVSNEFINLEQVKLNTTLFDNDNKMDFNKHAKKVTDELYIDRQLRDQLYFVKGFNLGVKSEFNNTWILVSLPETNFDQSQVNFKIDGGLTYGLSAGYDFNNKFGLQAEWHLVSQMAQRYEVTNGYTIQDRYIKLTYMNFPVVAKFKTSRLTALDHNPIVMNYIMGLQYGIIRTGEVMVANKLAEKDLRQQINSQQWSVVLGINYDLYLNKHLFFTLGGKTTFGKDIRPALFSDVAAHKSRNFTIGLEAGLHYKLFSDK